MSDLVVGHGFEIYLEIGECVFPQLDFARSALALEKPPLAELHAADDGFGRIL